MLPWPKNYPCLNPIDHLWDVLDQQIQSMEAPPFNLLDLNDLLLMSWCLGNQRTNREVLWNQSLNAKRVGGDLGGRHDIKQVVLMLRIMPDAHIGAHNLL